MRSLLRRAAGSHIVREVAATTTLGLFMGAMLFVALIACDQVKAARLSAQADHYVAMLVSERGR